MTSERVWTLRLGPAHPGGHGPIALRLRVDGPPQAEVVRWAEPIVQPLHRGAEKLYESRDYRQILMLADRHDWLSAFGSELGLALTMESMLGITVPDRASWIRTAMAELGRAIHHLRWLGETIGELGAAGADPVAAALREDCRTARERLTWLQEANSGGRIHPMLVVPGGVREDVPAGWTGQTGELVGELTGLGAALTDWIDSQQQLAAVGVLPADAAVRWATSGPVARGSGAELDLRIDEPYLTYRQLAEQGVLRAVVETGGGVQARLRVLAGELQVSLDCLVAAAADLADPALTGPVSVRLPRSLRVPEGSGYGWTENPTGINGWYLVSRGGTSPYRLKLRTASFNNAQALAAVVVGQPVADLTVTLMSFLLVAGDLAK